MSGQRVIFHKGLYNGRSLRDWLPTVVERIVAAYRPVRILLFGSLAQGTDDADSDIDLVVVLRGVGDKRAAALGIRRALRGVPVPVDVLVTDPDELERCADLPGSVIGQAARKGKVLYDETREPQEIR